METILVTGGTGFLGSVIIEKLLLENYQVVALVRNSSSTKRIKNLLSHPSLHLFNTDDKNLESAFSDFKIDSIIHTATCYSRGNESWSDVSEANLILPLRLFTYGERYGVSAFINADTFFNEEISFEGNVNFYVSTKKSFLSIAKQATRHTRIKFINFRIEQMYGPHDGEQKFIPFIISKLLSEKSNTASIPLTEGEQKRDFIFVTDVARAFVQGHKKRDSLDVFEEFGMGTGNSISIKESVVLLKEIAGSGVQLEFGALPYRGGEIMDSKADISNNIKIEWVPQVDLEEGLRATVDSYSIIS